MLIVHDKRECLKRVLCIDGFKNFFKHKRTLTIIKTIYDAFEEMSNGLPITVEK